jgi:Myb-like DNA-binding protein FlbD
LQLNQVHRHPMSWVEAPLPSPCSSETAESDAGSNYTTSPPHHRALPIRVQLPPLRSNVVSSPADPKLPSLSALASPSFHDSQPRLPPLVPQTQLLTAPNSPQHQQAQMHPQTQAQEKRKDSRMNLNSLLD